MTFLSTDDNTFGVIAVGNAPVGVVAIGGSPTGFIAIGAVATGVIALSLGLSRGLLAVSCGVSVGAIAVACGGAFGLMVVGIGGGIGVWDAMLGAVWNIRPEDMPLRPRRPSRVSLSRIRRGKVSQGYVRASMRTSPVVGIVLHLPEDREGMEVKLTDSALSAAANLSRRGSGDAAHEKPLAVLAKLTQQASPTADGYRDVKWRSTLVCQDIKLDPGHAWIVPTAWWIVKTAVGVLALVAIAVAAFWWTPSL